FSPIADRTFGDPDFAVSATGGGSPRPVTFMATGDCTVSSDGAVVHITGAGSCSITASQDGDADYPPATDVNQTFNIGKAKQTIGAITASVPSFTYGDKNFTVSAAGGGSDNPVTFTASGACASGGPNGTTIPILAAGPCTIVANQASSANYLD